jgi:periplasmic protein TonB
MNWPRLLGILLALGLHGGALYAFFSSAGSEPFAEGSGSDRWTVVATVSLESDDLFTQSAMDAAVEVNAAQAAPQKEEPKKEEPEKTTEPPKKAEEQIPKPEATPKEAEKAPELPPKDTKPVENPQPQTQTASAASNAQDEQRAAATQAARRTKLWSAYQSEMYAALERYKVKPHSNRIGEVLLEITIAPSGKLISGAVLKSSGVPELDRAALDSLQRAAPFPPIPPDISAGPYTVTVPFQYSTR